MNHVYRIIAVDDDYTRTDKVSVNIQIIGTNKTFNHSISQLYQKDWLDKFSPEDVAHIAALYTAEQTNNLDLIKQLPKRQANIKPSVMIVGILFTAFLILSNLSAFKLASFAALVFPAGLIFFPMTYVFDDILTEVYGFNMSRRIIWSALFANMIVFIGMWLTTFLPPAPDWNYQSTYALIYQATPRIFAASTLAYFFGEFANSIILAKLKVLTAGRHLWLRAMASTAIGVGIDTIVFIHIAFLWIIPYAELWKIILTMYLAKVSYEACAIPITYKITHYLKKKDNVDHYDINTNFNPFSLAMD